MTIVFNLSSVFYFVNQNFTYIYRDKNKTKLAIGAEGPGIENTLISFFIHFFTRSEPGSETIGVPASEIMAIE